MMAALEPLIFTKLYAVRNEAIGQKYNLHIRVNVAKALLYVGLNVFIVTRPPRAFNALIASIWLPKMKRGAFQSQSSPAINCHILHCVVLRHVKLLLQCRQLFVDEIFNLRHILLKRQSKPLCDGHRTRTGLGFRSRQRGRWKAFLRSRRLGRDLLRTDNSTPWVPTLNDLFEILV
jgi:hypothetical protein